MQNARNSLLNPVTRIKVKDNNQLFCIKVGIANYDFRRLAITAHYQKILNCVQRFNFQKIQNCDFDIIFENFPMPNLFVQFEFSRQKS